MNVTECTTMSLKLVNQYSIAGTPIVESYNNQSDALLKINMLIDDAQKYIATTARKIFATHNISQVEGVRPSTTFGGYNVYQMPDDFFQLCGRGIPYYDTGSDLQPLVMSHQYMWRNRNLLCIQKDIVGEFSVDYYRYPVEVTDSTVGTTELDNVIEAQQCVPFYVSAHLVQTSNPSLAAVLTNEFETKLSRISDAIQSEVTQIEDVFDFNSWGV